MKTILLVEDDENDILFVRHALKKIGASVDIATVGDGQKAIDYLDANAVRRAEPAPCLVLLDLNLPKKTGFQVLEWIRNQPVLKSVIVIIFTSSNVEADAARAYALCANSYLVKPSDPAALIELLGLVCDYWLEWNYAPPRCD